MNSIAENTKSDNNENPMNGALHDIEIWKKQHPNASETETAAAVAALTKTYRTTRHLDEPRPVIVAEPESRDDHQPLDLTGPKKAEVVQTAAEIEPTFNDAIVRNILENFKPLGLGDSLSYDTLDLRPRFLTPFKLTDALEIPAGDVTPESLGDLLVFIQQNGYPKATQDRLYTAVKSLSHKHEVSAFSLYLDECREKGHYRPTIWNELREFAAMKDEPMSIALLKAMYSAVYQKQTYNNPHDPTFSHLPTPAVNFTLFGPQAVGKTSLLNGISGGRVEKFSKASDFNGSNSGAKDMQLKAVRNVFMNADDMTTQQKSEVDDLKSLITMKTFDVRLPYEKSTQYRPVRCVWVATTNRHDIYTDTTGDRREYPVEMGAQMSDHEARVHGQKWFDRINGINGTPGTDSTFWYDVWFTFLQDVKTEGLPPVQFEPYSALDLQRSALVKEHHHESAFISAIEKAISVKFNGVVDPFTGQPEPTRDSVPCGEFRQYVRETMAHNEGVSVGDIMKECNSTRIDTTMKERPYNFRYDKKDSTYKRRKD